MVDSSARQPPQDAEALFLKGCQHLNDGDWLSAQTAFRALLDRDPTHAGTWNNHGIALRSLGNPRAALESFAASLRYRPDHTETQFNHAITQIELGNTKEALNELTHILSVAPSHQGGLFKRGTLLSSQGDYTAALSDFTALLALNPDDANAFYNRGTVYTHLKQFPEALQDFTTATRLRPHDLDGLENLARTYLELNRPKEAMAIAEATLNVAPDNAKFLNICGMALTTLGHLDQALAAHQNAYKHAPQFLDNLHNLGLVLDDIGQPQDAINVYTKALKISPNNPDIRVCRGLSLMMQGDFSAAWTDFNARGNRSRHAVVTRHTHLAKWNGENLDKTPLIIHAEQGFGDTLQFARFIPLVLPRVKHVIVEAPAPLIRLLETIPGVTTVTDNAMAPRTMQCPLLELPSVLGLNKAGILNPVGKYLAVPASAKHTWDQRIPPSQNLRIGIAWKGRPETRTGKHLTRGVPLAALLEALPKSAEIYPLQKDITTNDAKVLAADPRIHNETHNISDFADSAAIADKMDVIATIDTAPAHLALALARPTYVLLPYAADWRWMQAPEATPWYATAKLLRQETPGQWDTVLERLQISLGQ